VRPKTGPIQVEETVPPGAGRPAGQGMEPFQSMMTRRLRAARGDAPADLVLKGGRVVNVFDGSVRTADVAVQDGFVAGVGEGYEGRDVHDVRGRWIAPGLLEAHMHIESSMLTPPRLAAALLPRGTTAMVADPHEIANVMGLEGVRLLLGASRDLPFDTFFTAPSCVPATHLETSGARLEADDLRALLEEPRVLGLAELMNVPGLVRADPGVLAKVALFRDRVLDGHGPGLTGRDLQAYASAGIRSDHECTTAEEALEKVRAGLFVMIREGTSARNLDALLPAVTPETRDRFCFVSDDLHPQDILRRGHLDHMIRRAVKAGLDPVTAVRLASLNPARYFRLRDRGAVAPGFRADLAVLSDLEGFAVDRVYKAGRVAAEHGQARGGFAGPEREMETGPLIVGPLAPERFRIQDRGGPARVIRIVPGQIHTGQALERPRVRDGLVVPDTDRDILTLAVVERHRGTGNLGLGLVQGFGLREGALAGSVAHDSHNVIAVGTSEADLCRAVEALRDMGGGLAVVRGGGVLARVPLPIAGLLSPEPIETLVGRLDGLNRSAASLGCAVEDPFMTLSFLALPVIPALKLTDLGLVDVSRFSLVPLFAEEPGAQDA